MIGCLLFEPEDFNVGYFAKEKTPSKEKKMKTNPPNNYLLKNWSSEWKNYFEKKTSWGFFKPLWLRYAGRDIVNQAGKVTPKILIQATGEINKTAQERIDLVIKSGGAEIEWAAPKIIRGAIEEVYKTPFRMLKKLCKISISKKKKKKEQFK